MRATTSPNLSSGTCPEALHRVQDGDRGAEREGDFLDGRGAGFLQVIAADVDRVPLRHVGHGVGDHVGDQPHRRCRREHVGAPRQVLLDDVVLGRARQLREVGVVLLGDGEVERQHVHRRRVDRHGGVHLLHGDAVEQQSGRRRRARSAPRPCPPRRGPARRPGRNRSASAGRTRRTARSDPWTGCDGRGRWIPWPTSGRRTCASTRDGHARHRKGKAWRAPPAGNQSRLMASGVFRPGYVADLARLAGSRHDLCRRRRTFAKC